MDIREFLDRWFAAHPIARVDEALAISFGELKAAYCEAHDLVNKGLASR